MRRHRQRSHLALARAEPPHPNDLPRKLGRHGWLRRRDGALVDELSCVETVVQATAYEEFSVGPLLDDAAFVQNEDLVRPLASRQTVRDHARGAASHDCTER